MSERPWMKWYPSDWRADPQLRVCSLAARGLWVELLGLMYESHLIGYLLVNGTIPTPKSLAILIGSDAKSIAKLIAELEESGVFSRRESDGAIFSRRMVRDNERSQQGRDFIKKRWGKDAEEPNSHPNSEPTSSPNRDPNSSPNRKPITQKPEDRVQKEEEAASTPSSARPSRSDPPNRWASLADSWEVDKAMVRRPVVGGYYLDVAADEVCQAARINDANWRGDWTPLIAWLRDGLELPAITEAIRAVAARPNYRPAASLAYFDRAVREFRPSA